MRSVEVEWHRLSRVDGEILLFVYAINKLVVSLVFVYDI